MVNQAKVLKPEKPPEMTKSHKKRLSFKKNSQIYQFEIS